MESLSNKHWLYESLNKMYSYIGPVRLLLQVINSNSFSVNTDTKIPLYTHLNDSQEQLTWDSRAHAIAIRSSS